MAGAVAAAAQTAPLTDAGGGGRVDGAPRYGLCEPLSWRCIDGQWLVFGAASGTLLQADRLSAALLALIEEAPASQAEIVRRLAQDIDSEVTAELSAQVLDAIRVLARAELVECRPTSS